MSEEVKPEKKVLKQPSYQEIAENINGFEFVVQEVLIAPRIEVYKDGKMVRVIEDSHQTKYLGTMNPEYAEQFMKDIVADFKESFPQAYYRQVAQMKKQRLEQAQKKE